LSIFIKKLKKDKMIKGVSQRTVLLSFLFVLFSFALNAQEISKELPWYKKGWTVGANFGSNLFYGDLRVYNYWPVGDYNNERKYAGGMFIGKKLNSFLEYRGNLLVGSLSGTKRFDLKKRPVSQYFDTRMFEYSSTLKLDISSLIAGAKDDRFFSVYTYAGLGLVNFRSQRKSLITNKVIMSYGYKGTHKIAATTEAVIPIGGGFDFLLTKNLKLNIDASIRFVNTDKLDAYVNHKTGIDDMYGYTSIGVSYTFDFDKKKDKPTVVEQPVPEPIVEPQIEDTVKVALDSVITDSLAQNKISSMASDATVNQLEVVEAVVEPPKDVVEVPKTESVAEITPEIVAEVKPEPKPEVKPEPIVEAKPEPKPEPVPTPKTPISQPISNKNIEFRVQIAALHENSYSRVSRMKKELNITIPVLEEKIDGWNKYTVGRYKTLDEAQKLKASFVAKGKTDAFIVAYNNGKRVTIAEAQALLK
jgi:cell division septation protein DedD